MGKRLGIVAFAAVLLMGVCLNEGAVPPKYTWYRVPWYLRVLGVVLVAQ